MTHVVTVGLDSGTGSYLEQQGFMVATERDVPCEVICDSIQRNQCAVAVFGSETRNGSKSVAFVRQRGLNVPVICIRGGPCTHGWRSAAARFLRNGGDDVLVGPPNPEEVCASIRAVIRRAELPRAGIIQFAHDNGVLVVDTQNWRAWVNDRELVLSESEWRTLSFLATRRRISSLALIKQDVYGVHDDLSEGAHIRVLVYKLREKMGDVGDLLKSVRGQGYFLAGRVTQSS